MSGKLVIKNAAEVVTSNPAIFPGDGVIADACIEIADGRIIFVGHTDTAIRSNGREIVDATDRVVIPGFVDCHTHLVFAGDRIDEYSVGNGGQKKEAVLGRETGIEATVAMTRRASKEQLVESGLARLDEMLVHGTTTAEVKSGYGLDRDTEMSLLEAAVDMNKLHPIDLVGTYLGAHALPRDVSRRRYVELLTKEWLPEVADASLVEFCDVYCDRGYFSVGETAVILEAAAELGLHRKLHLDAYSHTGAAAVARDTQCVSVDHLNFTPDHELRYLADAGVVGVIMPALDFAVCHPQPVRPSRLRRAGMTMALATDLCPGCYCSSMQFVVNLAGRSGISVRDLIYAATRGAARALNRGDEIGSIAVGKTADLVVLRARRHEELGYRLGENLVEMVIKRGTIVVDRR